MSGTEIFLGAAAAPARLTPWFYNQVDHAAFAAKKDPFTVWDSGNPGEPQYKHIPPWEPGLALPLKVVNRIFRIPLSIVTLVGLQLGLDAMTLALIGLLCFRIGGPVGAGVGLWVYAGWTEAASASSFPFYYYWPNVFSTLLVAVVAALVHLRERDNQWTLRTISLMAGLIVGTWCWFRGTAVSLLLVVPFLVAVIAAKRGNRLGLGLACLVGALLPLVPAGCHNLPRSGSITPRAQVWHDMFIGIGTRPNPYGIRHDDSYAADLIRTKYGIQFQAPGYQDALKWEYLSILRENPWLIVRNSILNTKDSLRGWSLAPAPLGLQRWFWLTALLGTAALAVGGKQRLLLFAVSLWISQCLTLGVVKLPQHSYLWETLSASVIAGAGGLGAVVNTVFGLFVRRDAVRRLGNPRGGRAEAERGDGFP